MFNGLMLFIFLAVCNTSYSQHYYMDTISQGKVGDDILILKKMSAVGESSATKFEKSLIMYNDYSYYIDQSRKELYFLGSVLQSPGVNGKISVKYWLEKYSIDSNIDKKFESSFIITESHDDRVRYFLSGDGLINKITCPEQIHKMELKKISPYKNEWWEY